MNNSYADDNRLHDLAAAIINSAIVDYHYYQRRSAFENWQFGSESVSTKRRGVSLRHFFDSLWFEGLLFFCAPDLDADYIRRRIYSGEYNAYAGKHYKRNAKSKDD